MIWWSWIFCIFLLIILLNIGLIFLIRILIHISTKLDNFPKMNEERIKSRGTNELNFSIEIKKGDLCDKNHRYKAFIFWMQFNSFENWLNSSSSKNNNIRTQVLKGFVIWTWLFFHRKLFCSFFCRVCPLFRSCIYSCAILFFFWNALFSQTMKRIIWIPLGLKTFFWYLLRFIRNFTIKKYHLILFLDILHLVAFRS